MDAPNRYRIVRTLGRGGMAEVFEGLLVGDTGFTRRIALKRLLPEHAHVEWYARAFIDEARIGSQLHHGNIASILDFGTMDGLPFQVMELIDGLNLAELRTKVVESSGSFPPELALEIIIAVAHGLDYAHHALDGEGRPMGIVHRDITPDNVLVSWAGEVKLIDFGIALAHRRVEATTVGVVKGKLDYMAPEQVVAADVDARADLFATGCLLHFLLTGESPVSGRERDRLMSGQVKIDPTLSPMLAALIARATEHDRTRRWSSAEELAKAAETLLMRLQARSSAPRLRETVGKLRAARPAPSPAAKVGRLAELFQLDLVLEPEAEKSGLRRFASAMYRPAGLAEEQPTKTTVDFTNPNVQLAMSPHETANLRGPSASNTTRTPAPVLEMSGATRLDGTEIESTRVHPTSHDVGKAEATEVVTAPGGGPTESGAGDTQTMPKAQQAPALVLGGVRLTQVLRTLARAKLYVGEHASLQAPRVVVVLSEGEPAKIATQIVRVAQVRDPRVALIFESGQSEGRSFFVTESPLGQCLLDLAESERPLAPARGALWARQLAFAVAALRVGGVELEAIDPEAIFISEIFGTEALRVLPIDALGVKNPANDAAVLAPSMRVIVKALGEQSDTSPVARGLEEILRLMTGPEAAKMTAETLVGRIDQLLMSSPVFMARGTPTPMMTPTPVSSTFGIREIFALSVLALGMGAVAFALLTKPGATANYAPIEQRPPPSPTMV
ncbi:MAG: protein kinase, partial [Myxococcota bacterium]